MIVQGKCKIILLSNYTRKERFCWKI